MICEIEYEQQDYILETIELLEKNKKDKLIPENYAKHVELPKLRKKEISVWDLEQVNKFLTEIKGLRKADCYYTTYMIALLTGMRNGEILGLRWKDVTFKKKLIFVRQVLTHDGKELRLGTKTVAGLRTISISESLCSQLQNTKKISRN